MTLKLLHKHQKLDQIIRQLKSRHEYKIKPLKADITILGNKIFLRYIRIINNTSINENTDFSEYQTSELTVPCLTLSISMILLAFPISNSLNTKGHAGSEKKQNQTLFKNFTFQMHQFGSKYYAKVA